MRFLIVLICLTFTLTPALAEPATQPGAEKMLPEVKFEGIPLTDVVAFLRDVSGFNIVLQSAPGIDVSAIAINLQLKEVTLGQVLDLLTKLPGQNIEVDWEPTADHGGKPIVLISVLGGDPQPQMMGGGGGMPFAPGMAPGMGQGTPNPDPDQVGTAVLNLSSAFEPGLSPEDLKKRSTQITTLISSALEAANLNSPTPGIFFHPETQILIVRGTMPQRVLLSDLIAKLQEGAQSQEKRDVTRIRREMESQVESREQGIRRMEDEMKRQQMRNAELQHDRDDLVRQLTQLKAELDVAREKLAKESAELKK